MSSFDLAPNFERIIPAGDDRLRAVCTQCGYVAYENPKVVVGSVVVDHNRVLMCRRAIEPRRGFWTLPAGFLELGETVEVGAAREAREEACAEIALEGLLAIYSIPRISQVQLMFRARMATPGIAAGPESLEVAFVDWADIPWTDLAFPSVVWALRHYQDWLAGAPGPFANPA
jgi:ADP-ribose pyrophosphatase YjhB (NUDIX family)